MQISVVGCGWLGLPLAISLQKSGHQIVATCRSKQKADELRKLSLNVELFELGDELQHKQLTAVFASKVLVLNIPVGRKDPDKAKFLANMQALLKHAASSSIKNIVFISTTSVYAEELGTVTEQTPTQPQTESGKINLAAEALVREYFADRSSIIRAAGLVGKDRHPAKFLAGKTGLTEPDNVVNLIHQDDLVCAIQKVIEHDIWGQVLHLSALEHPTRVEYYIWAANKFGLNAPQFIQGKGIGLGKSIDSTSSLQVLGLSLRFPSPFDMIEP